MRKQSLEAITATVGEDMTDQAMEAWVQTHGSTAAAWLIFTYRKQIHARGFVDFEIGFKDKLPQWFRIAIEKIRVSEKFSVSIKGLPGKDRTWRLRWLYWGYYAGRKADDQTPGFGRE